MSCDTGVKPRKKEDTKSPELENNKLNKENNMNSSLVMQMLPAFKMNAYNAKTGHFTTVSSEDYKGRWLVVCFYPADFTFVCPTEIAAMNAKYKEFQDLNTDILAVSVDTQFSHKRFAETEPLLKGLQLMMGADSTHQVSKDFGIYMPEEGQALRGRFLFNQDGVCVAQEVQAPSVGRNVNEFLRQVKAWQLATETGVVCPAGWKPGKRTLPVNTDAEKMTGRVGDYITIEEIVD